MLSRIASSCCKVCSVLNARSCKSLRVKIRHVINKRLQSTIGLDLKSKDRQYKVVFIGSDAFSLPSLIQLSSFLKPENVSVVVSNVNNVIGKHAKKLGNREIFLWSEFKTAEFGDKLAADGNKFDFGVVASFGYLIPARVIDRFPLGILNVHGSLLPRWRGASPVAHAIMYGDKETGVSIMKIAPHRFDIGPVLMEKSLTLDDNIRAPELLDRLAELGANTLIEVIKNLSQCLGNPIKQDEQFATAAPKLLPEMSEVDWSSKTASEVYRLYRGLYGTFKLKTTFNERRVDLDEIDLVITPTSSSYSSQFVDSDVNRRKENQELRIDKLLKEGTPGDMLFLNDMLYVRCANSSDHPTWVTVRKIKLGTKWMSAKDFRNGFLSKGKLSQGVMARFERPKSNILNQVKSKV